MKQEENHQQAAEHCNTAIWTVFSVGIGVSLWILYQHLTKTPHIMILTFGFVVLLYSIMLTVSLSQQRKIHYIRLRGSENKIFLHGRRYLHVRYVGETILFFIALVYFLFLIDNFLPSLKDSFSWFTIQLFSLVVVIVVLAVATYNIYISRLGNE